MDWLCPYREPKQLIKVFSKEDIRLDYDVKHPENANMFCTAKCSYGEMLEGDE